MSNSVKLKVRRRFDQFLRDNNAASKFYVNRAKYVNESKKNFDVIASCYEVPVYRWLESCRASFSWDRTPEGFDFWYNLSEKWMNICEKKGLDNV